MVKVLFQAHHFIYTEYQMPKKGEKMSDTPTKVVVDCSTGLTEVIPLTQEEIAELEIARQAAEDQRLAAEAEAAVKAEQRQEILDRLGLTAEEAKILLG